MASRWANKNIVLVDHVASESDEYLDGLNSVTGLDWTVVSSVANKNRGTLAGSIVRYVKYFTVPFCVFMHRRNFQNIVGWQAFYGVNLAFFEKLFHVKKQHSLTIQHFIYKKKSGVLGRIYDRYIHYAIDGRYIDSIITCSRSYAAELRREFDIPDEAVKFVPFGVTDYQVKGILPSKGDYVFSLGRSNRDWDWLIEEASRSKMNFIIACDTLHRKDVPRNVVIRNDVNGTEALELLAGSFCSVVPIDNPNLSSGETVLLQSMCFGKPLLVTSPSGLASDYVDTGVTGFAINKSEPGILAKQIENLVSNPDIYDSISRNSRSAFKRSYSLIAHGRFVGKEISSVVNGAKPSDVIKEFE